MNSGIWQGRRNVCRCGLVVLLAEDDRALREVLARAIRETGHEVVEFGDGASVIEFVETYDGDEAALFLVTDVRMPGLSGLEGLAELRVSRHRLKSVVITAYPDERSRRLAAALGALALFEKPFDVEDLCTAIHFLGHAPVPGT